MVELEMPMVELEMPMVEEDMPLVEEDMPLVEEDISILVELEMPMVEEDDMPLVEENKSDVELDKPLVELETPEVEEDDMSDVELDKPLVELDTPLVELENTSLLEETLLDVELEMPDVEDEDMPLVDDEEVGGSGVGTSGMFSTYRSSVVEDRGLNRKYKVTGSATAIKMATQIITMCTALYDVGTGSATPSNIAVGRTSPVCFSSMKRSVSLGVCWVGSPSVRKLGFCASHAAVAFIYAVMADGAGAHCVMLRQGRVTWKQHMNSRFATIKTE
jgi:hypothetical protein